MYFTKLELIKFIRRTFNCAIDLVDIKNLVELFIESLNLQPDCDNEYHLGISHLQSVLSMAGKINTGEVIVRDNKLEWNKPLLVTAEDFTKLF